MKYMLNELAVPVARNPGRALTVTKSTNGNINSVFIIPSPLDTWYSSSLLAWTPRSGKTAVLKAAILY
jgi:hypothetical protein